MKKMLLFLLICTSSIIFSQEKKETSKIQIVEASCGQCQFGMKEKGKKVIFGESGIYNPIIDIDGKYAMSQGAMAIVIDNINDGEKLSKFLSSIVFNKIIKACLWSSFRIEWGMFKDLKKNFYEIIYDKMVTTKTTEYQKKS